MVGSSTFQRSGSVRRTATRGIGKNRSAGNGPEPDPEFSTIGGLKKSQSAQRISCSESRVQAFNLLCEACVCFGAASVAFVVNPNPDPTSSQAIPCGAHSRPTTADMRRASHQSDP